MRAVATTASRRPAFSMAELMIALMILGLGLLFIAAALPVGLDYARQTIDLNTGEAAADYAADAAELSLSTAVRLVDPAAANAGIPAPRLDRIFRPRDDTDDVTDPLLALRSRYEPLIKVRPLVAQNLGVHGGQFGNVYVDFGEATIQTYLSAIGWGLAGSALESDAALFGNASYSAVALEQPDMPPVSVASRVFPPVESSTRFHVDDFFSDNAAYRRFDPRDEAEQNGLTLAEVRKIGQQRIAWTAFYRRVSYRKDPGPDGRTGFGFPNDPTNDPDAVDDVLESDPLLYELIVVVTRRPSVQHRYAVQDFRGATLQTFEQPTAVTSTTMNAAAGLGADVVAPSPWLVMFDLEDTNSVPRLDPAQFDSNPLSNERLLVDTFVDPPTLTFIAEGAVADLLPRGSIFIPARNDHFGIEPRSPGPVEARRSGFVPHAPDALPIYRVLERERIGDSTRFEITVESNGHYPWVSPFAPGQPAQHWPVWVIPPAFVERSTGDPIFEDESPIVGVVRRYVRLREVP